MNWAAWVYHEQFAHAYIAVMTAVVHELLPGADGTVSVTPWFKRQTSFDAVVEAAAFTDVLLFDDVTDSPLQQAPRVIVFEAPRFPQDLTARQQLRVQKSWHFTRRPAVPVSYSAVAVIYTTPSCNFPFTSSSSASGSVHSSYFVHGGQWFHYRSLRHRPGGGPCIEAALPLADVTIAACPCIVVYMQLGEDDAVQ
jgi:hypothetical protein